MKKLILLLIGFLPLTAFTQGVNVLAWRVNSSGHQAQYYNSSSSVINLNDSSEVLELCYNSDTVHVRTSFLASYIMGDWPGDPFLADGQNKKYNFPRYPNSSSSTHKTKPTSITGLLVNGVPLYDDGDGKSYNTSTGTNSNSGSGVWNQLAWIAHAAEMDAGNCHPDPNNNYHNHFNPIELYDENASTVHSPIIGYAFDGFPVYGPFGYSTATDASSAIKRMTSSWSLRNITTRTTLYTGATASQTGPAVSATFPLGTFKEDYGYTASSGDLDYYNGRYCVTPEYPEGTYAYFLNTDATGEPQYPNMIGPTYFGDKTYAGITGPSSGNAVKISNAITCVSENLPMVTLTTSVTSIAEAAGSTTVTATLSRTSSSAVMVTLSFTGTATTTTDYTLSTTITIPAGSTSASTTLTAVQDAGYEGDETVIIDITAVSNGVEPSTQQKTVTITDDDAATPTVTLSTGASSVTEASGTTTVTATLSATSASAVTVNLSLTGTATTTTDYTLATSISIPAGSLSASITLTAVQDVAVEGNETVIIDISSVTNATESGTQQQTVTITDDDAATPTVSLSVGGSSIAEASGSTTVTATLSATSASAVTVNLSLTGTATTTTDYTLATSISIPAGSLSASITLTAVQDVTVEGNETVIIDISSVTNATESGTQQQTVTITDDDAVTPTVTLSVGGSSIAEASGSTTVTATLSATSASAVTVNLTRSGTATVTSDYTLATSISIPAGSLSASITLTAVQDVAVEGNETVIIDISSVTNATESGTQQQTVTITDDDAALPTATLSASASTLSEASGSVTLTATLSAVSASVTTITLSATGTASSGTDYTLGTTSITIPAGSTSGTSTITAIDDVLFEGSETIIIYITGVTNATESGSQQESITLQDNETVSGTVDALGNELKVDLYPSPVHDLLTISYHKNITAVSICDLSGREVLSENINAASALIDLADLPNGIYIIRIKIDDLVKSSKIIKQ